MLFLAREPGGRQFVVPAPHPDEARRAVVRALNRDVSSNVTSEADIDLATLPKLKSGQVHEVKLGP